MWVKICGNTSLDDALHAAHAGADALGFVFARSSRQVTPSQTAEITAGLPKDIERVGVFDSRDAGEIARDAREAGLTAVQLHGGLDEALLRLLAGPEGDGLALIQTLHWSVDETNKSSARKLVGQLKRVAEISRGIAAPIRVLVDSKVGNTGGGTGISFDWDAATEAFAQARALGLDVIAAGGLRPENVSEAIRRLAPWGVDVASGVEASRGRKDPERVATFIANARG